MSLPRTIVIPKSDDGYGFNIRGQVIEGGQVKAIHGKLYAPLQQISAICSESLAEKAGLQIGDRILQVYVKECFRVVSFSNKLFVEFFFKKWD